MHERAATHAPLKLHLSHHQLGKIRRGEPIQLKHEHIGHPRGITFTHLHPINHAKIVKAHGQRRGVRVHITHPEMHGTGFLDVLKGIASPVLSGLAGVAGELFPSHKDTINKVRQGIKDVTGYGIRHKRGRKKAVHHTARHLEMMELEPRMHFPGQESEFAIGNGLRHHRKKKAAPRKARGFGIVPAGSYY